MYYIQDTVHHTKYCTTYRILYNTSILYNIRHNVHFSVTPIECCTIHSTYCTTYGTKYNLLHVDHHAPNYTIVCYLATHNKLYTIHITVCRTYTILYFVH